MNRLVGIYFVLLSLIYWTDSSQATKVCLLRKTEQMKCSARGIHLDQTETDLLKGFCSGEQTSHVLTTRGAKIDELPFDCTQLNSSSYVWLAWNDFLAAVKPLTNGNGFREGNAYLGRNILQQEENAEEFCRIDLTTGHCVALAGNQSQNILSTEILVQRIPLEYALKTVHSGSWKNVTEGDVVVLASTHLSNRKLETQFVQKVVPYDLQREVHFDLPEDLMRDVKVNVYDEAGRLGLRFDVGDAATTLISKSVPAIKRLLPRTSIEVTVQGRNDRVLSKLTGDLITVFDRADDKAVVERFTKNLVLNRIDIGVQDVEVEYGVYVKLDPNAEIDDDEYPLEEEEETGTDVPETETELPENSVALFQSSTVYPGFHTVSTIAYMIFCTTFVLSMFDVARQLRKSYSAKKRAYEAVPTMENHH